MKHTTTIASLAKSLVAAQKELKAVAKDAVNPHFRNKYASLDGIMDAVRPTLAKHGLAIVQGADQPITDSEGRLCGFAVETMLVHESGEWLVNAALMPLTKIDAQGAGGAMTYGRRYGVSALLSLATDDDDDGNSAVSHQPRATAATSAPRAGTSIDERAPLDDPTPAQRQMQEEPSCPKCGGRMWDNRLTKRSPKMPDYKCRNKTCDGVIWPPRNAGVRRNPVDDDDVAPFEPPVGSELSELPF